MERLYRLLAPFALLLLLGVLAGSLAGCVSKGPALFPPAEGAPTRSVWIVNHRWHTGLVVRRADVPEGLLPELADFAAYEFVEIGWGERDFYMDAGDSTLLAIKAMLWLNDSVMHLVGGDGDPAKTFSRSTIVRVELSEAGFEALCRYVDASFARPDGATRATKLGKGLYGPSSFYEAHGTFNVFNVCNKWTAKALRAAGIPMTTWHVVSSSGVLDQAAEFGTVVQERD